MQSVEKVIKNRLEGNLVSLDEFLNSRKSEIISHFEDKINGLQTRVATAVKIISSDGHCIYVYKITLENDLRRGDVSKYDTPKGRVDFTAPGKWNVQETEVKGVTTGYSIATETNIKFEEYAIMFVVHFQVDNDTEEYLNKFMNSIPEDMGNVECYEWKPISWLDHSNSMTKIL